MRYNPFRDRLMTTHFDTFRSLVDEIKELKADLKNQRRRVSPSLEAMIGYRMIKQIALPLTRIFNSRKYSQERCVEMFSYSLRKLDLLIRELAEYTKTELLSTLHHIYTRLFNLLPKNTIIQHQLFDAEFYNNDSKKAPMLRGFLDWLQDYKLLGYHRRDIARRREREPLHIIQPSLRLR